MLFCKNCQGSMTVMDDAPCALCPNTTYRGLQLCDICTITQNQCSRCRNHLGLRLDETTETEIEVVRAAHTLALSTAEAKFRRAIQPYKNAAEAFEAGLKANAEKLDEKMSRTRSVDLDRSRLQALDDVYEAFEPYQDRYLIACNDRDEEVGQANWDFDQAMRKISQRLQASL